MLAHLVLVDHLAHHRTPMSAGATQRLFGALGGFHDGSQLVFGGNQQLLPLAPPLLRPTPGCGTRSAARRRSRVS